MKSSYSAVGNVTDLLPALCDVILSLPSTCAPIILPITRDLPAFNIRFSMQSDLLSLDSDLRSLGDTSSSEHL